ncbi:dihydrofolate reductase family protein [Streptomyces sp. NBC_00083]|uniref:dihydrofolate reductase family protein n=1 Tax=Streptomyces sp. NBC_00083 TaxID=2975647 RepID=UPI00224F2C64|nr:dihydrofolate reductase family protein [Streptomyces sp. NBC_00083]MCX5386460.1 dihydrofolate reductase family protein [Streptomyces sp. NBC_00083]
MKLTLTQFLTLDGVVQAPGGPDEDAGGGFPHGGWQVPFSDDVSGRYVVDWFSGAEAFLLGRRTYDIFAGYWPGVTEPGHPIAGPLNALPKYVVSTTLKDPEWHNTLVLGGADAAVAEEIKALKARPGGELQVHGSATLARFLMSHDLIDEYRLMTFPVVLGTGRRLFTDGVPPTSFALTEARTTPGGVSVTTYRPTGRPRYGSFPAGH